MILALHEDGVLVVYPSPDEAACAVEALDVETCLLAIFDENAQPYAIEWIRPNEYSSGLFGWFRSALNGEYRLVPSGSVDPKGLAKMIEGANSIEPDHRASTIKDLAERLLRSS